MANLNPRRGRNEAHVRVASQLAVNDDTESRLLNEEVRSRNELTPKAMRSRNSLISQKESNT